VRWRTAKARCRPTEGDEKAAQPDAGEGERTSEGRRAEGSVAADQRDPTSRGRRGIGCCRSAGKCVILFHWPGEERTDLERGRAFICKMTVISGGSTRFICQNIQGVIL
jgi:hypothetical protein